MCLTLIAFGFEPQKVEEEMGSPELQLRFMDCLKLIRRQQQMQATTLIGFVGSFLAKEGQKTIIEEINNDIAKLSSMTGNLQVMQDSQDTMTDEERQKEEQQLIQKMYAQRESFIAHRKAGTVQNAPLR